MNQFLKLFCVVFALFTIQLVKAETYPQIINVENRKTQSLDGVWKTIVDPFENGYYDYRRQPLKNGYFLDQDFYADKTKLIEYNFDTDRTLVVPGDWNTQREKLYYYEGTVWYRKHFSFEGTKDGKRQFIYFGAANYEALVYLNGKFLGKHLGGFTPFNFEITEHLEEGENSLIVKLDNKRYAEAVPTLNSDWWNYGGITRSVILIETPQAFIRDYMVQLKKGDNGIITGWVQLDGSKSQEDVTVEIPELKLKQVVRTDSKGYASFEVKAKPEFWSPENPKLYNVRIASKSDKVEDEIGFRTFEARGAKLYLNGKEIFCRGISIHEEAAFGKSGRAHSKEEAEILLGWAKEMGCNFVRLAHYPHNEYMVRTAEKMGLMVWSEIPVYWTIQWDNKETYANAEQQLVDMITRDKNRASVVFWSVANETPHSDARLKFLKGLIDKTRSMDDTRLVSAAMEKEYIGTDRLTVNDALIDLLDIISFNQYVGWYDGNSEKCDRVNWSFDVEKPVLITEFGGCALYGRHGDVSERFTEEYMEDMYIRSIGMFERMPQLAGTSPWILKDFRSPRRQLVDIQDDFNRKGLISENGGKKKAFYVMQKWYKKLEEQYKNK